MLKSITTITVLAASLRLSSHAHPLVIRIRGAASFFFSRALDFKYDGAPAEHLVAKFFSIFGEDPVTYTNLGNERAPAR